MERESGTRDDLQVRPILHLGWHRGDGNRELEAEEAVVLRDLLGEQGFAVQLDGHWRYPAQKGGGASIGASELKLVIEMTKDVVELVSVLGLWKVLAKVWHGLRRIREQAINAQQEPQVMVAIAFDQFENPETHQQWLLISLPADPEALDALERTRIPQLQRTQQCELCDSRR